MKLAVMYDIMNKEKRMNRELPILEGTESREIIWKILKLAYQKLTHQKLM